VWVPPLAESPLIALFKVVSLLVNSAFVVTSPPKETTAILVVVLGRSVPIKLLAAALALVIFVPAILPERSITSTISVVFTTSLASIRSVTSQVLTMPSTGTAVLEVLTSPGSSAE